VRVCFIKKVTLFEISSIKCDTAFTFILPWQVSISFDHIHRVLFFFLSIHQHSPKTTGFTLKFYTLFYILLWLLSWLLGYFLGCMSVFVRIHISDSIFHDNL
jgi:hypothetical protein